MEEIKILLRHGASLEIKKQKAVWYFVWCMPWRWCAKNRNWYENKTAVEIARAMVEREEIPRGKELDDCKKVLKLLENPPPVDHGEDETGRTDIDIGNDEVDGIGLMTQVDSQEIIGNPEDNLGLELVSMDMDMDMDHDAEQTSP